MPICFPQVRVCFSKHWREHGGIAFPAEQEGGGAGCVGGWQDVCESVDGTCNYISQLWAEVVGRRLPAARPRAFDTSEQVSSWQLFMPSLRRAWPRIF